MPVTTRSPKAAAQDTGWRLEFPAGIPAFEQETAFVLLRPPETEPLVFLQSEKTAGLCFLAVPVERVVPDYELALSAEDRNSVGFAEKRPAAGLFYRLILEPRFATRKAQCFQASGARCRNYPLRE